jgi:hypothetical protein
VVCTSILAVKYLYKYVTKGADRAVMTVKAVQDPQQQRQEPNEVLRYLNARYISPVEACMRIMTMEIQGKTHSVTTLTVHLKDCQMVTFCADDSAEDVLWRAKRSMLTSFFDLCASDAHPESDSEVHAVPGTPENVFVECNRENMDPAYKIPGSRRTPHPRVISRQGALLPTSTAMSPQLPSRI